jgi:uncharacterized glyoxalase superfamily protein PhnB
LTHPRLLSSIPQLFVADIAALCAYFSRVLGFETVFVYDIRESESLVSADFGLAKATVIEQLFADVASSGASFHQHLRDEP